MKKLHKCGWWIPTNVYGHWRWNFAQIHMEVITVIRKYVWYIYSILCYIFTQGSQVSYVVNLGFNAG